MKQFEEKINNEIQELTMQSNLVPNNISDGYHTFGELYKHRIHLFIALMKEKLRYSRLKGTFEISIIKSKLHNNGSEFEGWFIIQFELIGCRGTQISYHLPNEYWDKCDFIETVEKANEWDGHTSDDVLDRLLLI